MFHYFDAACDRWNLCQSGQPLHALIISLISVTDEICFKVDETYMLHYFSDACDRWNLVSKWMTPICFI